MTYSVLDIDNDAQLIENIADDQKKKYVYMARALPIENVVFSGGGAKGVVYPGVIQALQGQPIKNVAGSSIGAVTAALYASGMSGFAFEDLTMQLDFKELLGSLNVKTLKKTGEPLLNFLKTHIADSILTTLKAANKNQFAEQYQRLSDNEKNALHTMLGDPQQQNSVEALLTQIQDPEFKITTPVTFSMLATLTQFNEVAGIDGTFKDLSVTAVNKDSGELYIFNAKNTPDMEIALASRASASLPVLLEPVEIDSKSLGIYGQDGKAKHFVDGGFLDNIPVTAVDAKQEKEWGVNLGEQGQNLQTLAFIFDETTDKAYPQGQQSPYLSAHEFKSRDDLYVPGLKDIVLRNIIPKIPFIGGIKSTTKNTVAKARGLKKINTDFTQRNVPLIVEGIGSTSFDEAKDKADDLIATSKAATSNYLINHLDEAIYLTFDSPVAMMLSLPMQRLQKLINDKQSVYGLSSADLKGIQQFRKDVGVILTKLNNNSAPMPNALRELSRYLSTEVHPRENTKASYAEYIVDQLHANKTAWNELIKNKKNLPAMQRDLMDAINKRDAQDQLVASKYEIARWLDEEALTPKNANNTHLLQTARDKVIGAESFAALSAALDPIRSHYQGEAKKITMLSLLKKPAAVSKAEKFTTALDKNRLLHDPYLQEVKPVEIQPALTSVADRQEDTVVAVIDLSSLTNMTDVAAVRSQLQTSGVTDIYFLAAINPDSLMEDIRQASQGNTPEAIIQSFQNEGFNTTVITPMDSASDEIKMGSTYRYGIQPQYDRYVAGNVVDLPKEDTATVRAMDVIGYENVLRRNVRDRTPEAITQLMQKKLSSHFPEEVQGVIYIGKENTVPQPFLKQSESKPFYLINTAEKDVPLQTQLDSMRLPEPQEEKLQLFTANAQWQERFNDVLDKINAYADTIKDPKEKENIVKINQIKMMHGTYEEKTRLAVQAFEQYQAKSSIKHITDPLAEMKGYLDGYIGEYGKGFKGLYTKIIGKLNSDSLRAKKLEFAKTYSEHIGTVLSSAKTDKMNASQLQNASQSLLNMFNKSHEEVYKGNEADKNSPTCPFKKCITKMHDSKEKLQQALETSRPSFR